MSKKEAKMKPIWYFVGLVLFIMGLIIFLTGIFYLFSERTTQTVLSHLYPDIWWGGFMVVSGLIFIIISRKQMLE